MKEIIVFAMVGIVATLTHYIAAILVIEQLNLSQLFANVAGYCVAVLVSYLGHTRLTFNASFSRVGAMKFIIVSLSALLLSQLLLALLVYLNWFSHRINFLFIVFSIPAYSFMLNKFWVYKN